MKCLTEPNTQTEWYLNESKITTAHYIKDQKKESFVKILLTTQKYKNVIKSMKIQCRPPEKQKMAFRWRGDDGPLLALLLDIKHQILKIKNIGNIR